MQIRKANLSELALFALENELHHLESIARTTGTGKCWMLTDSIKRMQNTVTLLLDNVAENEKAGVTQSQLESRVAEYDLETNSDIAIRLTKSEQLKQAGVSSRILVPKKT